MQQLSLEKRVPCLWTVLAQLRLIWINSIQPNSLIRTGFNNPVNCCMHLLCQLLVAEVVAGVIVESILINKGLGYYIKTAWCDSPTINSMDESMGSSTEPRCISSLTG